MHSNLEQRGILLKQALPYINKYRNKSFIFVIPASFFTISNYEEHGIWRDISACCSLGVGCIIFIDYVIAAQDDMPVTDKDIAKLLPDIAGLEFKCRALLSKGAYEHGHKTNILSGCWILAQPKGIIDGKDMHRRGKPRNVDSVDMHNYLRNGNILVANTLAPDKQGQLYLLSTHEAVLECAISLPADKIILYIDQLPDEYKQKALDLSDANNLLQQNNKSLSSTVTARLKTLLTHAIDYCSRGVNRTHIISFNEDNALFKELLTTSGCGVMINSDNYESLAIAERSDIEDIKSLIAPLEEEGMLRPRSYEQLLAKIDDFCIIKQDDNLIGCAALSAMKDKKGYAELECVVVKKSHTKQGYGKRLLNSMEKTAITKGYKYLVVFTTQASAWFEELGYQISSEKFAVPEYCRSRNSKNLVKDLYKTKVK